MNLWCNIFHCNWRIQFSNEILYWFYFFLNCINLHPYYIAMFKFIGCLYNNFNIVGVLAIEILQRWLILYFIWFSQEAFQIFVWYALKCIPVKNFHCRFSFFSTEFRLLAQLFLRIFHGGFHIWIQCIRN